jgi:hypothetical protein
MQILRAKTFTRIDGARKTMLVLAKSELAELLVATLLRRGVPTMGVVAKAFSIWKCPGVAFAYSCKFTWLGALGRGTYQLRYRRSSLPLAEA